MYSFKDDYSELGHERVFTDLLKISNQQLASYGLDSVSRDAKKLIQKRFALKNADIHFISGGTQTNAVFCKAVLSSIEAVISADSSHICVRECGAVEYGGNKILTAKNKDGKLMPCDIERICAENSHEHTVKPKLVIISQATETGTVYTKQELKSLYEVCKNQNLYFYIDGARIGAALTCNGADVKCEDYGNLCDAFYIGGTKNGSPLGEALCIINNNLKQNFRYFLKQHGALLSKSGLIGSCFKTLFNNDLFFELATHANAMAQKLANAFIKKGYKLYSNSPTNQIFPILPNQKITEFQKHFEFYVWKKLDDNNSVVRLVCSWAAKEDEVDKLIGMFK